MLGLQWSDPNSPKWWIAHYKVTKEAKDDAFLKGDIETYKDHASMSVKQISNEDRELADKFSLGASRIALHRKDVEEKIIQLYARDEKVLNEAKQMMIADFRRFGKPDLCRILWGQTCERLALYFSKKMVQQNKQWWSNGDPVKEKHFGGEFLVIFDGSTCTWNILG